VRPESKRPRQRARAARRSRAESSRGRFRRERDVLGELALPRDALYGIQTARSLANLSFSGRVLGDAPGYVAALLQVKRAAAGANRAAGVLDARRARALEAAVREAEAFDAPARRAAFPVDPLGGGGSLGVNANLNEVLANLASERLGGRRGGYQPVAPAHANASQSTADVCHTALRVAILGRWPALRAALASALRVLEDKVGAWGRTPTLARTCLRDALAVPASLLPRGHAALLARRLRDLETAAAPLVRVSLGGTAVGTGAGAPAAYRRRVVALLAEGTGLPLKAHPSRADALQNGDDVAALSSRLALLADAVAKLAQDLRLLSSGPAGGFGELLLPPVQPGSSFFAGKWNPLLPESAIQCALQVRGLDHAVQLASQRAELHLHVFDGLAGWNVLDAMGMLTAALQRLEARCLRGLRLDAARCAELASRAPAPAP
jgi:aspartate ammonia-lyase